MPADNWEPWWRWELPTRAGEHDVSAAAFPQSSDQSQQRVGLAGAAAADFNLPARPAREGAEPANRRDHPDRSQQGCAIIIWCELRGEPALGSALDPPAN